MSEETVQTQTSTDTVPSSTDAPPAAPAPAETPAAETPAAPEADTSVLGGEVEQREAAEPEAETPAGPPEKYELSLEGVTLDEEMVAEAEPIFRELGLSNDQANALLPLAPKLMERAQNAVVQQMIDQGAQQRKDWLNAFVADPEIGGAKREETEHLAAKGLDALGFGKDHPFRKALTETGFGNHPDMIRAFRSIGQMVGEDGLFARENPGVREDVPAWKKLYPND